MKNLSQLIVLISPPASGKTYWIETFYNSLLGGKILVVSPLRALADECREKWNDSIKVVTPEEWLMNPSFAEVVIFDEFHLNFYWGDTFRPILWEVFYELSYQANLSILLTATLSPEMETEVALFKTHFDETFLCDFGNRSLKNKPKSYLKAPSKQWITKLIEEGPRGNGVNLIFCAYRDEVKEWEKRLVASGFTVWSCVGGEASVMRTFMAKETRPDFIVATSVLSHGVNLPAISCIFFLYPLKNIDFWIQMVARGGRKGENYEVFALENPHFIQWNPWTNFLAILPLRFKMWVNSLLRELDQWFLKELS